MSNHTNTVSTLGLRAGDAVIPMGGRIVASVERSMSNLGAALIRFTDGSHLHAGTCDAWAVSR